MEQPESSEHDMVLSDPYACLPIANDKNAGEISEIHLAGRGIDRLARLEAFVSLDCLWLNKNRRALFTRRHGRLLPAGLLPVAALFSASVVSAAVFPAAPCYASTAPCAAAWSRGRRWG